MMVMVMVMIMMIVTVIKKVSFVRKFHFCATHICRGERGAGDDDYDVSDVLIGYLGLQTRNPRDGQQHGETVGG
jgi:hypothetical protein